MYQTDIQMQLELPELPGHWLECFGEPGWLIVVPGTETSLQIPPGSPAVPCIRLPKLQHQSVLAFPTPCDPCVLPPAAGVFPLDSSGDGRVLTLRWEQGPVGEILQRLLRQGLEVEALNVPRLCREILARSPQDPWALDLDGAAAALVSGSFRVTDLRSLPCRVIELELAPGRWFLESPFFVPTVQTASSPTLTMPDVPFGLHSLFEVEAGWVADLWVDERQVLRIPARRSASPARRSAGPARRSAGPPRDRSPP
ncbi:MAG: hypothetical protein JW820_19140 [Spirochaetales bacterium]|nr:hypothetical protein [Spirochaetales bacterium]